jgi:tripartite-type tricarboxylate transporter receptor subunit TctC
MRLASRRSINFGIATTLIAGASGFARRAGAQQPYPSQTVRIIVPVPPGSAPDFLARVAADYLQNEWKQPFIVESRPGASQNIGAEAVFRAKPDGYTLLSAPPSPFSLNQHLFNDLKYEPDKFAAVTIIASVPNLLIVRPTLGARTVAEFVEIARKTPEGLVYASTGRGSTLHLSAEMLKARTGLKVVHIPFKGVSEIMTEFLAGRVDFAFLNMLDAFPQIQDGKLVALAIGDAKRNPAMPDLPTLEETWPGFLTATWYAIAAPPGTPQEIREKLASGIRAAFQRPESAKRLRDLHAVAVLNTPDEAQALMRAESERWRDLIVSNGL